MYACIQTKQRKRLYRVKSKNLFLGFLCYASFFWGYFDESVKGCINWINWMAAWMGGMNAMCIVTGLEIVEHQRR